MEGFSEFAEQLRQGAIIVPEDHYINVDLDQAGVGNPKNARAHAVV